MEDNRLVVDAVDFSDVEEMEEAFTPLATSTTGGNGSGNRCS